MKRLVTIHVPNGTTQRDEQIDAPEDMAAAFASLRERLTYVQNLNNAGIKNAQSRTGYYTAHTGGFHGSYSGAIQNGLGGEGRTFDQDIADMSAGEVTLPTLAINCFQKRNPQEGVAPATFNTLSWRGPGDPVQPYEDPRRVFERLFSVPAPDASADERARLERRARFLDAVNGEIRDLRRVVDREDARRLDEYLTGIEELDLRTRALADGTSGPMCATTPLDGMAEVDMNHRQGEGYARILDLMYELSLRALQCGHTRVVSFMHCGLANGSEILGTIDRSEFEGVSTGWHGLSHWNVPYGNLSADVNVNRRDFSRLLTWHYSRIAGFVHRLAETPGPDGVNLLDDTLVAFGSHMSYGAHHSPQRLVQAFFGGGSTFHQGTTIDAGAQPTPNLWAAVKRGFGVPGAVGTSEGEVSAVLRG